MTTNTIVTIGYYHFHLPMNDATKLVELLSKSRMVDDAYDRDASRRGDVRSSYWHFKDSETVTVRLDLIHSEIEAQRRPELPEETASAETEDA